MRGRAAAGVVGLMFWAVVGMVLWRVFVHDPPNPDDRVPATTTGPAYWSNPALLLGECIRFPWPEDDADMSQRDVWVRISDVVVKPCADRLDLRVTEVDSQANGCGILADQQVSLLGLSFGDRFDYVLCLRWHRPNRT